MMNKNQEEFNRNLYQLTGVTILLILRFVGMIGGILYLWEIIF